MSDVDYKKNDTLAWHDIAKRAELNPIYHLQALRFISGVFGYMPFDYVYYPHLANLTAIIEFEDQRAMTREDFIRELVFQLKAIRNDDIKKGGWISKRTNPEATQQLYDDELAHLKIPVRERLIAFLGYEPSLEHSLEAEVYIRRAFSTDVHTIQDDYGTVDYKAAAIVKYKEVFSTDGEAAADASKLFGLTE